jgi:putative transposase
MTHPYPPRWTAFSYIGRSRYAITFVTDARRTVFDNASDVDLVLTQILRAASELSFAVTAYCFMLDHLHLIVEGTADESNCRTFIKASKQYSGYYYKRSHEQRLWERYGHERVIRDDQELAMTVRYVVANPVRAGLVQHPRDYLFLGSQRYTVDELLQWCEYSPAVL